MGPIDNMVFSSEKSARVKANDMNLICGKLTPFRWHTMVLRASKTIRIENRNQPLATPLQAIYCESFPGRLRGLMFHSSLAHEEGLLLVERCDSRLGTSIHMLFVTMDLAVIWINSKWNVVDTILARSWRSAYTPHQPARYILEIHPSRFNDFKIGDHVEFQNA